MRNARLEICESDIRLQCACMSELLVFMVEAGIIVFTASGSRRACLLIMDSCFLKFSDRSFLFSEDERSPKQVLRLYNQCFQFGLLVTHVIEKPVKLSARKFYNVPA
jgi:hypothetical protein